MLFVKESSSPWMCGRLRRQSYTDLVLLVYMAPYRIVPHQFRIGNDIDEGGVGEEHKRGRRGDIVAKASYSSKAVKAHFRKQATDAVRRYKTCHECMKHSTSYLTFPNGAYQNTCDALNSYCSSLDLLIGAGRRPGAHRRTAETMLVMLSRMAEALAVLKTVHVALPALHPGIKPRVTEQKERKKKKTSRSGRRPRTRYDAVSLHL